MVALMVYCLADYHSLEEMVKDKLGYQYSLEPKYQPKIYDGSRELTPIRNFMLIHYKPYNKAINQSDSADHIEKIIHLIGLKQRQDYFTEIGNAINQVSKQYRMEGKHISTLIEQDHLKRVIETGKSLKNILRSKKISISRILNPHNTDTQGLFIFLNSSAQSNVLIANYDFIDGLEKFDFKYTDTGGCCR